MSTANTAPDEKMALPGAISLSFLPQELQMIAGALGQLPYVHAAPILESIQRQVNEQRAAQSTAAQTAAL